MIALWLLGDGVGVEVGGVVVAGVGVGVGSVVVGVIRVGVGVGPLSPFVILFACSKYLLKFSLNS